MVHAIIDEAVDLADKVASVLNFLRAGQKPECITEDDKENLADIGEILIIQQKKILAEYSN